MGRDKSVPLSQRASLTLNEACTYVGVGYVKGKKLMTTGAWRWYQNGKEFRIIRTSIDEWMEAQAEIARKAA